MKQKLTVAASLAAALLIQGCAPSQRTTVTSARDPLPEDCQVRIYAPEETRPDQYEFLGTVKSGEKGLSIHCSKEEVREAMRVEACKAGANGVIIVKEKYPDVLSTCYRATAELVHIGNN